MVTKKSLKDISWLVSENTYRQDSALSYSTLARYEREGFNGLSKLFDKLDTPFLTFGSAVDSIITGGKEEFEERFLIAEFPSITDNIIKIVKSLFNRFNDTYRTLNEIPDTDIIYETITNSYQLNWKPETRAKVIKEKGGEYYNILFIAKDKTILDTKTVEDVFKAVSALKTSEATKWYFSDIYDGLERLYQLKFKGTFNNVDYRCMADLLIVNHEHKWVMPIDLKTSSHKEWDFAESFNTWLYNIQSRLYSRIIKQNMENDDYFKDFDLLDYRFIVVNRYNLTPLVWKCDFTKSFGTLIFGKDGQIQYRDPFIIGEELKYYLDNKPIIPKEITIDEPNDLVKWLNKI